MMNMPLHEPGHHQRALRIDHGARAAPELADLLDPAVADEQGAAFDDGVVRRGPDASIADQKVTFHDALGIGVSWLVDAGGI